jgi:hypothetical protein
MSEPSNIRINPFVGDGGTTTYINLTETHIIPSVSPYVIRLNEVPEKQDPSNIRAVWVDSSTGAVTASALTEVAATPAAGEFRPDYATKADGNDNWNTGLIEFSAVDAGKIVQISYTGMGTLAAVQSNKYPSWYTDRGDGSDGDFIPEADCTIGSIKNYKSVYIKEGITVSVNKQLVIKSIGSVVIAGTINGSGSPGANGKGGAGGALGGDGGWITDNEDSNEERKATVGQDGTGGGYGGAGGANRNSQVTAGGASHERVGVAYGGNGGGGGGGTCVMAGYTSGGGGGGGFGISIIGPEVALLEGSKISAEGGNGQDGSDYNTVPGGGGGGGTINIISNSITNSGTVSANGGKAGKLEWTRRYAAAADGENGTILIKQLGAL